MNRRPRPWHIAIIVSPAAIVFAVVIVFATGGTTAAVPMLLTLVGIAAGITAMVLAARRWAEYRGERAAVALAKRFAVTVPPGQENRVSLEFLTATANAAHAASNRTFEDRLYWSTTPVAVAEQQAEFLRATARRAAGERARRLGTGYNAPAPAATAALPPPMTADPGLAAVRPAPSPDWGKQLRFEKETW